jgi:transposase
MPCPSREKCIRSTRRWKRRSATVWADGHQQALEAARSREKEPEFAAAYARRAGIEGTISRAVRTCGVRRSRYVGLEKTQLHHLLSAAALNFLRAGEWLIGTPKATTRHSPFARLVAATAAA